MKTPRHLRQIGTAALGLAAATWVPAAWSAAALYTAQGSCAGYPKVAVTAPKGWCVGLVADARDGLRMPRRLLEVAPGRFWVIDMGSWEPQQGRLLELRTDGAPGGPNRVRVLAQGLDRPHGLARSPDGRIYIGEAGTVWRTPMGDAVQRENVITGLPDDGAHPLKELAFAEAGRLFVNVGSATDACRNDQQRQPQPCPEGQGGRPRAAVYEARLGGPGMTLQSLKPYATGLRNSLGLVAIGTAKGTRVWQAENSVDYVDATLPAEELNALQPGSDHGWPYCVTDAQGRSVVARGYERRATCSGPVYSAAFQAWPAHVAPLQLLAVAPAASGQEPRPWSGRLLAVWHGYRDPGHRIVAWRLGADGQPEGRREDILSGWDAAAGVRPLGTPAGATVDAQGRLWVVEDRNHSVLVVAPDHPAKR